MKSYISLSVKSYGFEISLSGRGPVARRRGSGVRSRVASAGGGIERPSAEKSARALTISKSFG